MSSKYCKACGKPNDSSANFCSACGTTFVSLAISNPFVNSPSPSSSPPSHHPAPQRPVRFTRDDDDYEDDNVAIPNIQGLEVEIIQNTPHQTKIGDIACTSATSRVYPQIKEKKISRKAFLEQFKREAGGNPIVKSTEIS